MVGGGLVQESDSGQPRSKHAIDNTLVGNLGRFLVDEGHSAVRWATSAQRVLFFVVAVVAVLAACGGDVGGGDDGGDAGGREGGISSLVDEGHSAVFWAANGQRVICFMKMSAVWGFNRDWQW